MKRIAFLSFDWDYRIVSEYYLGLQEYLRGRSDMQVIVFNAYGRYYASHEPKQSSFQVFDLFDPASFDGLLVQGNRSWPPHLRQQLVDAMTALKKPVVSINYDLEGAHTVGTNNYQEEYDLVRRVLCDHGRRHPAFVNGLSTSVEAQARAQGFRDACAELGVEDARFYQANWQISAGVVTAMKILRKPRDLPDVIFCCNDDLAVGIQETLQDAGVQVPEQVMITGFDNREIGRRTSPHITTVDRDYRTIAATAIDLLGRLMGGEEAAKREFSPGRHILTESCGYASQGTDGHTSVIDEPEDSLQSFVELFGDFQSSILDATTLYGILEICELFSQHLDCPGTYLSLNEAYLHPASPLGPTSFGPVSCLAARKGRAPSLVCNDDHVYQDFHTRQLLPPQIPLDHSIYVISPLRHNETCMGMLVTDGVPLAMRHGFVSLFLTALAGAIEVVRLREQLGQGGQGR